MRHPDDVDQKHEKDLQHLKTLCLLDDELIVKAFEDPWCAELLLRIILSQKNIQIIHLIQDAEYTQKHTGKICQAQYFRIR